MQARALWSPPSGPLGRLTHQARERAAALGPLLDWRRAGVDAPAVPSFREALAGTSLAVIAEVKRRSPSRGRLNDAMDAPGRARLYEAGGASALSILTEPAEFGGSVDDLVAVRQVVSCPLLRKDFHVHPVQLFEARSRGASAALLIVRALGPDDTRILADAAREAGVEPLFEIRDEAELSVALDAGARVIGVNRRNLETLDLESDVPGRLLPLIPRDCLAVAESGIATRADVEEVASLGADAVLVGSILSVSTDPRGAVTALCGVSRGRRRD